MQIPIPVGSSYGPFTVLSHSKELLGPRQYLVRCRCGVELVKTSLALVKTRSRRGQTCWRCRKPVGRGGRV